MSNIQTIVREGISQEAIEWARKQGENLATSSSFYSKDALSPSQLRKFYGELKTIQAMGFDNRNALTRLYLLQAKVAYAVGKAGKTKSVEKIKALEVIIREGVSEIHGERIRFDNFLNIIEAIVAYHKLYFKD